jgi:hypothetical protein
MEQNEVFGEQNSSLLTNEKPRKTIFTTNKKSSSRANGFFLGKGPSSSGRRASFWEAMNFH